MSLAAGNTTATAESHFTDAQLDELVVALVQGTNLFGDKIYSYVQLPLRKYIEMARLMRDGKKFKSSDFGTVLAAGKGEPTAELKQEMAVTHNLVDVPKPAASTTSKAAPAFAAPKFWGEEEAE